MNNIRTIAWQVAATVRLCLLIALMPVAGAFAVVIIGGRWLLGCRPEVDEPDGYDASEVG